MSCQFGAVTFKRDDVQNFRWFLSFASYFFYASMGEFYSKATKELSYEQSPIKNVLIVQNAQAFTMQQVL